MFPLTLLRKVRNGNSPICPFRQNRGNEKDLYLHRALTVPASGSAFLLFKQMMFFMGANRRKREFGRIYGILAIEAVYHVRK